jgi:ferredoxin
MIPAFFDARCGVVLPYLVVVPKLIVLQNSVGPMKSVDVSDGGELVDLADEHWLPIPFSCRSATCGTCHIEVVEGAEHLEPADADETDLLDMLGGAANTRLACQVRIKPGAGTIKVCPV